MYRLICNNLTRMPSDTLRQSLGRLLSSPLRRQLSTEDTHLIMTGGLEKLQGGLKEESYFRSKNYDLITKIREQGSKLKCEECLGDWAEFERVLEASVMPTQLRDTCSMNRHKNGWEEAFFLDEQNVCTKLMKDKLEHDSNFEFENPSNVRQQEEEQQKFESNEDQEISSK